VIWPRAARAEKQYGPGAGDTEIKVGNIMPYSGPASAFSLVGRTIGAYFNKLNADGGINGRKIKFISYDDGYGPSVLRPAGLENAKGILSSAFFKDPTDPAWNDDAGVKAWSAFMDQYFADGDRSASYTVLGYTVAQTFVQVIRQCGDDLTRENLMKQAADLRHVELDMLLPGITVNTSPDDYYPIKQSQMMRFDAKRWERFGPILGGETG
jgi:branched-chain amino acid transport system substrate-binding protein